MAEPPDGFFLNNLIFYGANLSPSTVVARGASWEIPDLRSADEGTHEAYYDAMRVFLGSLSEDQAVQFQWRVDADYHDELENYRRKTEDLCDVGNEWCRAVRTERYERASAMMNAGLLRRERLDVFVGRRCTTIPKNGLKTDEQVVSFLDQQAKNFAEQQESAMARFPGLRVKVMGDKEHFATMRRFLNPSSHIYGDNKFAGFDANASILSQCVTCDAITTREEGNVVFKYDGCYHAVLVVKRWPQATTWGVIWNLTGALSGNYTVTLNCYPQKMQNVVAREEKDIARLKMDLEREKKPSLATIIGNKEARVKDLTGGFIRPFSALLIVRVFAQTIEDLTSQVIAVKNAIAHMEGAQYWQVNEESQARNLFFESFPGWVGGRYRDWDLYAETSFLPDLVPMSSSYTGHFEEGEAIYDGAKGNLCGVRTFSAGTPQHGVAIGMTRAGKSSWMIDLLSQTDCFYQFTGIIEEGLSYGTLVSLLGGKPIVLMPDGDITLNYLDTQGLPLSQSQIASASALLLVMASASPNPEVNAIRKAMLSYYVDQIYTDVYEDWRAKHPDRDMQIARLGLVMKRLERRDGSVGASFGIIDRFLDMKQMSEENPDEYQDALSRPSEDDVLRFMKDPATWMDVRNLAFALFEPDQFPTHSSLVELLKYNPAGHHKKDEVNFLAAMLEPWIRSGPYGKLFDGVTNRRLDGRVAHFELGYLPRSAKEMKDAAVFAAANFMRQHIVTLPRAQRKRFIFEEPSRYLDVAGAEEMFKEFYAQLGKFGCVVMPVTQQYAQLAKSTIRAPIFGNSKQFFLLKQQDRQDLNDIGDTIGLPNAARAMIRNYVLPEHQRGQHKWSDMAVFSMEQEGASTGTVRNICTPEMLYVSDSSGETFDERTKALALYDDPIHGVFNEVQRWQREKARPKEAKKL